MKHRTIAFMIIWAYLACALWLPLGVADVDWSLYLFPPGYFFALGGAIGLVGEWLAHRRKRLMAILPLLALSWELGIGIYGGHTPGLFLSAIFVLATLCAYQLTPWLARFTKLVRSGGLFGGVLCFAWLFAWGTPDNHTDKAQISPGGEYIAWVSTTKNGEIQAVRIGPRISFLGAFSNKATGLFEGWGFDEAPATITDFKWTATNTMEISTDNSGYLKIASPSVLLPIWVTRTVDRANANR